MFVSWEETRGVEQMRLRSFRWNEKTSVAFREVRRIHRDRLVVRVGAIRS